MTANKKIDPNDIIFQIAEKLKEGSRAPNIKKYSPHEKQFEFHSSLQKKKLYIGGNRSGKTTGGVCEDIWRATCTHPYRPDLNAIGPNRGRVIGVDFINGIEKIIFPQFKQWIYPSALKGGSWESAYEKWTRTLTFSNGSTIEFMSYDQDLDKFAGTSRHWIHFDEEPPQSIYIENMARLIDTDGDFWITMTPVDGMTWVYDDLYEGKVNNADSEVLVVEVNTLDNPYLSQNAIKSFSSSVDKDEVTTRIGGKFVSVGGRVYKNFDPTPGGLHVLTEPFDDPAKSFRKWLWICSLDHGLNNPTAVYWTAWDANGFGVVFREHYKREWTIDQHAKRILEVNRELGRSPDFYVADPSIQNRSAITNTSIHQEYMKHGIAFTLGNNDVKAGIVRFKRYLNPAKLIGPRNEATKDWDGDTFPRLRFTPDCEKAIWELRRYRWKTYTNKKLQHDNNNYEEPHKKDDHSCDSLRYMIMTRPDLIADNENLHDRVSDIMSGIGQRLGTTSSNYDDPFNRVDKGWQEGNSLPVGNSDGWEYDEHMGGVW